MFNQIRNRQEKSRRGRRKGEKRKKEQRDGERGRERANKYNMCFGFK